jgi:hypothetical protein
MVGAVYRVSIRRHFTGQTSTQALHVQQRRRSMFHSFCGLVTMMASVGQRFAHAPQKMQMSISFSMCPRLADAWCAAFCRAGYSRVAGREKRFLSVMRVIPKTDIPISPYN